MQEEGAGQTHLTSTGTRCATNTVTAQGEGAEKYLLRPVATTSAKGAPTYLMGCPVWFHIRSSTQCGRHVDVERGVIRAVGRQVRSAPTRYKVARGRDRATVTVAAEEMAFVLHCPMYVNTKEGRASQVTADGVEA